MGGSLAPGHISSARYVDTHIRTLQKGKGGDCALRSHHCVSLSLLFAELQNVYKVHNRQFGAQRIVSCLQTGKPGVCIPYLSADSIHNPETTQFLWFTGF